MSFHRLITLGAVAVGLFVLAGVGPPGSACPATPPDAGYHERCVGALAPVLALRPEKPAAGDSPLRRLMKLRYDSASRPLAIGAQRVEDQQDAPETLFPILKDVGESRLELCDDPSALLPVLEARLGLARLVEATRECEVEVGRATQHDLEDARYTRLDAKVRLARARAALETPAGILPPASALYVRAHRSTRSAPDRLAMRLEAEGPRLSPMGVRTRRLPPPPRRHAAGWPLRRGPL